MSLQNLKDAITSKAARQILLTQKHSPKILFAVGTVAVVGATVLACRATLKMDSVLTTAEEKVEKAKALHTKVEGAAYSDEDLKKDLIKIQVQTGLEIAKLYAPAILVGVGGITALAGSHIILTKRNGALMAGYAALDRAYKEYRQRVATEYGVETDRKFASGAEPTLVEEKLSDGTTKTSVGLELKNTPKDPYVHIFDERSKKFSREPGRNPMTISMVQNYATDKLRAQGHLFMNEVLEMLDLPKTPTGQFVGWVYRHDNEEKNGDNYVDFGVFQGDAEYVESFLDGVEKMVVLTFNVDGPIYNLI